MDLKKTEQNFCFAALNYIFMVRKLQNEAEKLSTVNQIDLFVKLANHNY